MILTLKIVTLISLVILITGCSQKEVVLKEKNNFTNNNLAKEINSKVIKGNKVLFIADNQKAMTTTIPIIEQSKLSEKTVNTAHRRAALDEFSLDIIESIINREKPNLIIHAGDMLNNSCKEEYKEVSELLKNMQVPWFIAPGNHDGYYLGISSPTAISKKAFSFSNSFLDERAGWALTCNDVNMVKKKGSTGFKNISNYKKYEKSVVDKVAFNGLYLNSLDVIKFKEQITAEEIDDVDYKDYKLYCKSFDSNNLHKGFMSNICWTESKNAEKPNNYINNFNYISDKDQFKQWEEQKPWLNFIVQKLVVKLDTKTIDIIIIDTSSYTKNVGIKENGEFSLQTYGAADAGHFSKVQFDIVKNWLNKERETYIIGHHPLLDFNKESISNIHELFSNNNYNVIKYISGDTHDGYDVKFKIENIDNRYLLNEANLGSTIDAPIEYANLGQSGNEIIFKRKSLTPLTEKRTNKDNDKYKKSTVLDVKKNYAVFDKHIWKDVCEKKNKIMFAHEKKEVNIINIPQADYWLGLPYLLNPFSIMDIRQKALEAYKINRLSKLIKVYNRLFNFSNISKSEKLIGLEKKYNYDLKLLKKSAFEVYFSKGNQNFRRMLRLQDDLIQEFRNHDFNSEKSKDFRICNALYDAEIEYRDSLIEKLSN